jgi:hypothetical protein
MKKMILLVALIIGTQATWAKAPADDSLSISPEQIELTDGKIAAGISSQKNLRVEDMKIQVLELLQRVSTVEKLNIDREHPVDVSLAIQDLKKTESTIEGIDVDTISIKKLDELQETLNFLSDEVEMLTLEL